MVFSLRFPSLFLFLLLHICDIWVEERHNDDAPSNDSHADLVHPNSDSYRAQSQYVINVLNALGIRYGAAHLELRMKDDGPCLIELAARMSGNIDFSVLHDIHSLTQLSLLPDALLDTKAFLTRIGNVRHTAQSARKVYLSTTLEGDVLCEPDLARFFNIKSVRSVYFGVNKGDYLYKTNRALGRARPGYLYMVSENPDEISSDYKKVRQVEHLLYKTMLISPEKTAPDSAVWDVLPFIKGQDRILLERRPTTFSHLELSSTTLKVSNVNQKPDCVHMAEINTRNIVVPPLGRTNIHNHHDKESWSIVAGEGLLSSRNHQVTIRSGDYIEFEPFQAHSVENRGAEDLRFTTRWYVDWDVLLLELNKSPLSGSKIMIETAFPTPNGPLHLGHLSGAYLMSDLLKRCCELVGIECFSYSGTYGHTNHIDKTAAARGMSYADLVSKSEQSILQDLDLFQARYDDFLPHAPSSDAFKATTEKFITELMSSSHVIEREVDHPYSESSKEFVCESYVAGQCPHCSSITIGLECEVCGLYQDECRLIAPFHYVTKEKLVHRRVMRLYLRLDYSILDKLLVQIYSENTASSRICYDSMQKYIKNGVLQDIPLSSLRSYGVAIFGKQVLSVVMERALRSYYGLSQYSSATRHTFFCGFDNLCGSGIFIPYILKIVGIPDAQLPIAIINNFCLLENKKFSTGANHAIWANEFLRIYPSDIVRLYLSKIHSPTVAGDFCIKEFFSFSKKFISSLHEVFDGGQRLAKHYAGERIEAGPWLNQDIMFYRNLNEAMHFCINNYTNYSPRVAIRRIDYLLETTADYIGESRYYKEDQNYLRTRLAILVYAYQCLAYCLYPVTPTLSARIIDCLGVDRSLFYSRRHAIYTVDNFDVELIVNDLKKMQTMLRP